MGTKPVFWDRMAKKYAASPIRDEKAYDATMDRVADYLTAHSSVLEIGCGTGATALRLAPFAGSILATDYAAGMIKEAQARPQVDNVTFRQADIFDPDLAGQGINTVMAFNLFHLVHDIDVQLGRIAEVLPTGGLFISKTVCLNEPGLPLIYRVMLMLLPALKLIGKAPDVIRYSIADLEKRVQNAGFEIIESGNYPETPPSRLVVARKL